MPNYAERYDVPSLLIDNPGGSWLAKQQRHAVEEGFGSLGQPLKFGEVTATFNSPVVIEVEKLAEVKGLRGEQYGLNDENLLALIEYMRESDTLPLLEDFNSKEYEYVPFIQVDCFGTPWVNEGNHRIMAAKALGWSHLPCDVRYFAGGEKVEGDFHPKLLAEEHRALKKASERQDANGVPFSRKAYRWSSNPLEERLYRAAAQMLSQQNGGLRAIVGAMLSEKPYNEAVEASDQEVQAFLQAFQWVGSPAGQSVFAIAVGGVHGESGIREALKLFSEASTKLVEGDYSEVIPIGGEGAEPSQVDEDEEHEASGPR